MSILLTSSLQKSLSKLSPAADPVSGIIQFIEEKTSAIKILISQFEANIVTLSLQKDRCSEAIAILEEAGGLTVRARNYVATPQEAEKYRDKTKDLEDFFKITLSKLDAYVTSATDNGINLLNGGNLVTKFDDKDENALVTHGLSLDSETLGIRPADFANMLATQNARIDIMNAMDMAVTLRNIIASDISAITSSLEFSISTIDNAKNAALSFDKTTEISETKSIIDLSQKNISGDESLAEPEQQEIFNSFASSPNMPSMEDI